MINLVQLLTCGFTFCCLMCLVVIICQLEELKKK